MPSVRVAPIKQAPDLIQPLTRMLNMAYYGGFPYIVSKDEQEQTALLVPDKFNFPFLLVNLLASLSLAGYEILLRSRGLSNKKVMLFHIELGFKQTDAYSMVCNFFAHTITSIALFWIHRRSAGTMTHSLKSMHENLAPFISQDEVLRALQSAMWKMKRVLMVLLLAHLCQIVAITSLLYLLDSSLIFLALAGLLQMILTASAIFSALTAVNFVLIDYILGLVVTIETNFGVKLDEVHSADELDKLLKLGYRMHNIKRQTSRTLSLKIMIVYVNGSLCILFGAFFGTLIISALEQESGFNLTIFMYGLFFILNAIAELGKILSLIAKGQKMKTLLMTSQEKLENMTLFSNETKRMSSELQNKINCLTGHWQSSGLMRPLDAFNIDNSSTLVLFGTLLTYIIVLLQFKFGEN